MSFGRVIVGALVLLTAAALWLAFGRRAERHLGVTPRVASHTGSAAGKPSPLVNGRVAAPAIPAAQPPVSSPDATTVSPEVPVAPATPPLPIAGVSFPADRKGFANGCKGGTLTLAPTMVSFICPSDPRKAFSAPLSDVRGPEDDGIQLVSGEKYHFKIEGHDKDTMRTLFQTWFARAHTP